MKKALILILALAVSASSCNRYKDPEWKGVSNLEIKSKRKYLAVSAILNFGNTNDKKILIKELYADVKLNGKDVGSIVRGTDLDVSPLESFRLPFYIEADKESVGYNEEKDIAYEIKADGFIRCEIDGPEVTRKFNFTERCGITGKKNSSEDNPSKDLDKELKKQQNQMKKDEKKRRRYLNEVSS